MNRSAGIILVMAATIVALQARSQEPARHFAAKGIVELGGSVAFQTTRQVVQGSTGDPAYLLSAVPYAGYFVADGLELGLDPLGIAWSKSGGNTVTDLRILAAPSYNFRTRTVAYPFLEGLAGFTLRSSSANGTTTTASGFSWGGRAGVKMALAERALLTMGGQYLAVTLNPSGVSGRNGEDEFSLFVGWTVWFL